MSFWPISQKVEGLELIVAVHTNINVPIAILLSHVSASYDLQKPRYGYTMARVLPKNGRGPSTPYDVDSRKGSEFF